MPGYDRPDTPGTPATAAHGRDEQGTYYHFQDKEAGGAGAAVSKANMKSSQRSHAMAAIF